METIEIRVDGKNNIKPFKHFYAATGNANTDFTYMPPTKKMYEHLSSFNNHFEHIRQHNILTSHGKGDYYLMEERSDFGNPIRYRDKKIIELSFDTVVSLDKERNLKYDWTTVDKVYDILHEHNIKPFVETIYLPSCIKKSTEHWFIPSDFHLWVKVLKEFVIHLQTRYGKEEIETWYFEVWNEPDNHPFWVDDPQTFLALYDYMEYAIHSVNPNIKVGGPAVKQKEGAQKIFKAFLEHCAKGLNYATGTFGTRLDFISVHCKAGYVNSTNPSMDVMFDSVKYYLDIIKEYDEFKNTEFINNEADIVWQGNKGISHKSWLNFRNTHYFPGFVCKMVDIYTRIVEDEYRMNLSLVVSDNCHLQWERSLFSGNRSQFTPLCSYPSTDIIKKPAFNAYVLLSRLGDQRMQAVCENEGYGTKFGILPTLNGNALSMMVWNFEDGMEDDINPREINVCLDNLPFRGAYKLIHYRIGEKHSSSYNVWRQMGKPAQPSCEQIKVMREKEGLELFEAVKDIDVDSNLLISLKIPMHSVSLIMMVPKNNEQPCAPKIIKGYAEKGFNHNNQIFIKWTPNTETDFLYYKVWRKKESKAEFILISGSTCINTATFTDMSIDEEGVYTYKIQSVNASGIESELSEGFEVKVSVG